LARAARVLDPASGRGMEVQTTAPAVQFYAGGKLPDLVGRDGRVYGPHHGLCLEAGDYPDAPNRPSFPDTILRPGRVYSQCTVHKFFW
jgi:aldose 1-epimerase